MPNEAFVGYILTLLIALLVTPIIIRSATRLKILDIPGGLKNH